MTIPKPDCHAGYSRKLLLEFLPAYQVAKLDSWMNGQTMMLCDGRSYNHELRKYEPSKCGGVHGAIVYASDLERFLARLPVID